MKPTDRRSFLKGSAAVATGLTLPGWGARVARAQAKDPIKMGFLTPLTGAYAAEAADQQTGATLAVEEINARGGLLGRKVELLIRDDQLKPGVGAQKAKELIESEKVQFMAGGFSAAVQMAVNEQTKKAKVIYVSTGQSNEITAMPDWSPYTFHEAINPFISSHAAGTWAANNLGKRFYVLAADYAYGHQLLDGFTRVAKATGGTMVGSANHPIGTGDYSAFFPRIQAAKPEVLVLANFGKDQLNSVKQAHSFGLKQQMKVFCPILLGTMRREGGPDIFEGVYGSTTFYWELAEKLPSARRFVDAYQKRFTRLPFDYAGYAYSGVRLMLEAAERAKSLEPDKVAAAIEGHAYEHYKGKQWIRKCDHQSFQDVYIIRSRTAKEQRGEFGIFDIVARVEASESLERSCKDLGHA